MSNNIFAVPVLVQTVGVLDWNISEIKLDCLLTMHPCYKLEITPIVVGAMGYAPKFIVTYLEMVGFEVKEIKLLERRMQVKSVSGSVKICKTFLNFNDLKM